MDCGFAQKATPFSIMPHDKGSGTLTSVLLEKMEISSKSNWLGKGVFSEQNAHTVNQQQVGLAGAASVVGDCFVLSRLACVYMMVFLDDIQCVYGRSLLIGRGEPIARA